VPIIHQHKENIVISSPVEYIKRVMKSPHIWFMMHQPTNTYTTDPIRWYTLTKIRWSFCPNGKDLQSHSQNHHQAITSVWVMTISLPWGEVNILCPVFLLHLPHFTERIGLPAIWVVVIARIRLKKGKLIQSKWCMKNFETFSYKITIRFWTLTFQWSSGTHICCVKMD